MYIMFSLFKKNNQKNVASFLIGGSEYQQFKDLSEKTNLFDQFSAFVQLSAKYLSM